MTRAWVIAASLMLVWTTSSAAPKKKKKGTTSSSKRKAKGTKDTPDPKGVKDSEVELDMGSEPPATPPVTTPPPEPTTAPAPVTTRPPINDRSITMPKGKGEVHGGLPINRLSLPDGMGGGTSSVSEGLSFGASYGVNDKLEIGGDYALSLHPGSVKGPLTVHGVYQVVHGAQLDIAIGGALVVHPIESTDLNTMETTTTAYAALDLGAWARYRLAPKVSLFTGVPGLPHRTVPLSRLSFALPPQPYQLVIGLNNKGAIAFALPVGIGIQATPQVYAFAAVTLLQLNLANTQNAFLIRDFVPIALGGFYALPKLDVGATFATDGNRKQGASFLSFELEARYFF